MKRIFAVFTSLSIFLSLMVSQVFAAGFALPEQGMAAMGMSSAFVGQADDPSAVWYNPAGITQLDGFSVRSGAVLIYPAFAHENTDGTTDVASRASHMPAIFYTTYKVNDRVALGFGVNNPFGLATDWHHNSETSQVALLSQVISTEFNPNVAFKITKDLSLAVGVTYVYLAAKLTSMVNVNPAPPPAVLRYSELSGSGDGWGGNIAAHYKISDSLSTGISYRSRVKVEIKGNATLGTIASQASTAITLPDLLAWGISYKPTEKLTLNADLGYTWWSTYDTLVVAADNPIFNKSYDKQWNDVWNIRFGGEYRVTDNWKIRAGLQYDKNPVPDHYFETRVPDTDRAGVSIGAGYTYKNLTVDFAYLYLKFLTRNIGDSGQDDGTTNPHSLNGTYKADAHVAGLSLAYKF